MNSNPSSPVAIRGQRESSGASENLKHLSDQQVRERQERLERLLGRLLSRVHSDLAMTVRQWERHARWLDAVLRELKVARHVRELRQRGLMDVHDLHLHRVLRREICKLNPVYQDSDLRDLSLDTLQSLRDRLKQESLDVQRPINAWFDELAV